MAVDDCRTILRITRPGGHRPPLQHLLVDCRGFAPCSSACKAGDLLNDRAAQVKLVAGAGVEPARGRRMRPLPFLLATPRFEIGTASRGCAEEARFWRPGCASWRPPCCDENWSDQPELHRHRLNGVQASCFWTMIANERRGLLLVRARAAKRQKEQTPLPAWTELAPAG